MINLYFSKRGWTVVNDDSHNTMYERHNEEYNYDQILCICKKFNGKIIIQAYDKRVIKDFEKRGDYWNSVDGIPYQYLPFLWLKSLAVKFFPKYKK